NNLIVPFHRPRQLFIHRPKIKTMLNLKMFLALDIPLTVSFYSLVLNVLKGSSFVSLPVSIVLCTVFLVISVLSIMHVTEKEEIKIISDHHKGL
ncbi:MAG: hypothetical protein ABEJ72_05050, partial [Candidatus Aenigmatarchaeota archaeon]